MNNDRAWNFDVNGYARALRLLDAATTQKTIEYCHKRIAEIRATWPQHSKIFDQMDRDV